MSKRKETVMNSKVKWMLGSVLVICLAGLLISLLPKEGQDTIDDIKKIKAQESFAQGNKEYIVYFWQDACSYCKQIENAVLEYRKTGETPIYIVDMGDTENADSWYDWQAHHNMYDKVIGRIENGKEITDANINPAEFLNDKEVVWSIQSGADNKLIAVHQTPFENKTPASAAKLAITGTPTMLKIDEGMLSDYRVGVEETVGLLKN